MKKRIRGVTSASRGEKERKRGGDRALEREWQNGASERRASHRRHTERSSEERRRRWAVSRVWQLFRARGDGVYDDEEREAVDQSVGRMNEKRRKRRKCEGAHRVGS